MGLHVKATCSPDIEALELQTDRIERIANGDINILVRIGRSGRNGQQIRPSPAR